MPDPVQNMQVEPMTFEQWLNAHSGDWTTCSCVNCRFCRQECRNAFEAGVHSITVANAALPGADALATETEAAASLRERVVALEKYLWAMQPFLDDRLPEAHPRPCPCSDCAASDAWKQARALLGVKDA